MNRQNRLNHTFKLWKDFSFEAAHQLTKVPTGHQCGNLHGHSYKVRVHCEGKLDERMEWVVDYADIAKAVRPIIEKLDHTFLNHHLDFETTIRDECRRVSFWACFAGMRQTEPCGNGSSLREIGPTTSRLPHLVSASSAAGTGCFAACAKNLLFPSVFSPHLFPLAMLLQIPR